MVSDESLHLGQDYLTVGSGDYNVLTRSYIFYVVHRLSDGRQLNLLKI